MEKRNLNPVGKMGPYSIYIQVQSSNQVKYQRPPAVLRVGEGGRDCTGVWGTSLLTAKWNLNRWSYCLAISKAHLSERTANVDVRQAIWERGQRSKRQSLEQRGHSRSEYNALI